MAVCGILLATIFTCFFVLTSQNQLNSNDLINELSEAKLKISRLESVLEEIVHRINDKSDYLKERQKLIEDMADKIRYLQSALSDLKVDSMHADKRLRALEEEVQMLWDASRMNNFDLHVLETKAQDAEDKLEAITLQAQKMAEVVTEQWIQIQHLEQAAQIMKVRALKAQRQRYKRCTFLKFINDLCEAHLPKVFGALDSHSFGEGSMRSYISQALQQIKRFFSTVQNFHHKLQGFIKQEMEKTEFTAAIANWELVFFLASAVITFPILSAWVLLSPQFS